MPAFANTVGNDYGAHGATPVTHTLVPNKLENGIATYVEAGATPLDDIRLTVQHRRTSQDNRIKVTCKLYWPITATETINGVSSPVVVRTGYGEITWTADAGSSLQERENLVQLLRDATAIADQPGVVFCTNSPVY